MVEEVDVVSTLERVRQIVAAVLRVEPATVTPSARLADLAELDSLSLAELASALDDEFAVRVPADDLTTQQTVDDLAAVVSRAPARTF